MLTDQQGNSLSGATGEAIGLFDQAINAFNLYRGDPVAFLERAIEISPEFAMARIAKAYMFGLATEPAATAEARSIVTALKTVSLDDREAGHVAVLELLLDGQWTAAAEALDRHNASYPRDMLALQSGHLMDFYRASARNLRDRLARVLPRWSADIPGYSILLGMHAFGLEECGNYGRAEEEGRRAIALQPLDCWAHHAVAHVMEMQGRAEDGIGWMITREPYWSGDDNVFKIHNWWHKALCYLELGQTDDALALYDGPIRAERSSVALDLIDASALLWRLRLLDHDVRDRWQELSDAWTNHADGKTYAFNDWHAVMAHLGAERNSEVEQILAAFGSNAAENVQSASWAQEIGVPLVEGFAAFWRGDYRMSVDRLYSARHIANSFGGSHAQRDIIDWTLTEAALRGGLYDLAEALANERLALKPHSAVNRNFLARACNRSAVNKRAA